MKPRQPQHTHRSVNNPFPSDFLWGASTASHQVEGGTTNQWTEWELANAQRLAKTARLRLGDLPTWQGIKAEASDPENYVSGKGVEHYTRYQEDFDLIGKLHLNAFRFGIEWSRLEPRQGEWNQAEIDHYHDYIDALLARGITPVLNMWHWTIPVWFAELGGFSKAENIKHFERFTRKITAQYGSKVPYIITLNEPNVYTSFGYLTGEWPPALKQPRQALTVYRNLVKAHKAAYEIIKTDYPEVQVGVAAQLANIQAERPHNMLDSVVTKAMRYGWNWWFLNRIRKQQDFVGINYYFTDYYRALPGRSDKAGDSSWLQKTNPRAPVNDLGWYMEPEGLYPLLLSAWRHYRKPIIVTENGLADGRDASRQWWLEQTLVAMERAISKGVDVRGYMHWSLLDNFEWAYGWWPRFGLVAVDREHGMKRTIRPSAVWFGTKVAAIRGIQLKPVMKATTPERPVQRQGSAAAAAPKPRPKPQPTMASRFKVRRNISGM